MYPVGSKIRQDHNFSWFSGCYYSLASACLADAGVFTGFVDGVSIGGKDSG
jgi:hypothetical protein